MAGILLKLGDFTCAANKDSLLGKGSLGVLYCGYHTQTSIQVAVKVYHSGDAEDIEREVKSYECLAKLQLEPNPFLKMFCAVSTDGVNALVLECC